MKKLFNTLIICISLQVSKAQIVYTDINPDFETTIEQNLIKPKFYSIDLNKDNIEDYNVRYDTGENFQTWFMHLTFSNDNKMAVRPTDPTDLLGGTYLIPMDADSLIDEKLNWGNSSPEPFIGSYIKNPFNGVIVDSNFLNLGDKYVALRFNIKGNIHYGWLLINFMGPTKILPTKLIIKEFGFNSEPNKHILAGQKVLSNSSFVISDKLLHYPNPSDDVLNFDDSNIKKIEIYTLLGAKIFDKSLTSNTISIKDIPSGMYVIKYFDEFNESRYYSRLLKK